MNRIYIITIIVLVIALVFTFQNITPIPVKFIAWHFNSSVAAVTITTFFTGFIGGMAMMAFRLVKKNQQIKALKKQIPPLPAATASSTKNQ